MIFVAALKRMEMQKEGKNDIEKSKKWNLIWQTLIYIQNGESTKLNSELQHFVICRKNDN